nr:MAG TPA: hypothetical protein [Caudoviricetes sp.]
MFSYSIPSYFFYIVLYHSETYLTLTNPKTLTIIHHNAPCRTQPYHNLTHLYAPHPNL